MGRAGHGLSFTLAGLTLARYFHIMCCSLTFLAMGWADLTMG